jgi:hypothetical protein
LGLQPNLPVVPLFLAFHYYKGRLKLFSDGLRFGFQYPFKKQSNCVGSPCHLIF